MASNKRSHNKVHMCVSCGEKKTNLCSHVTFCRKVNKEKAVDLLGEEVKRADKLRLESFSIEDLKSKCGSSWPLFAYAYVMIGIPIITGPKQAVNSVDKLRSYVENETEYGHFICNENGIQFNHMEQNVTSSCNAESAIETPIPTALEIDSDAFPSCTDIPDNNTCSSSSTSQGHSESVETPECTPDQILELGQTQLCFGDENDDFSSTISTEELSPINRGKSKKRNRIDSLSPDPKEIPSTSNIIAPAPKSRKGVMRENAEKNYAPMLGNESLDDDVNDPSYQPEKEVGLKAKRKELMNKMSKKNYDLNESDSSSSSGTSFGSDLENDEAICLKSNAQKRREMKNKMADANLCLSDAAIAGAYNENSYLIRYLTSLRIRNYSQKHINMTQSNILRTMQFFAENNDIDAFNPQRLLEIELRAGFYESLKTIGVSSDTVSKYCQALSKMVDVEAHNLNNDTNLREAFRLACAQVSDEVKGLKTRFTKTTKERRRQFENNPVDYEQCLKDNVLVHDHLKSKSKEILFSSKLPEAQDLRIVNMFFYSHFLLYGQRPSAFINMPLNEVRNAKLRYESEKHKNEDAERYLATDDHKTGNIYMARVPFSEEDETWPLLNKYVKKLRPTPADESSKVKLFLNSKGKKLDSTSGDFNDILSKEGLPKICSTKIRHAIETFSYNEKSTENEKASVASVLSHSLKTAQNVYVDEKRKEFYSGVRSIRNMYKSVLGKSPVIDLAETTENDANQVRERSESPASSTNSNCDTNIVHGTMAENRKKFIASIWTNIEAETVTPSAEEYSKRVKENPQFGLLDTPNDRKNFQNAFLQMIIKKRVQLLVNLVRRETLSDPKTRFTDLLKDRKWFTAKTLTQCVTEYTKSKSISKRSKKEKKNLLSDKSVIYQIENQEWIGVKKFSSESKGAGLKATIAINPGTIVCDYHGDLLSYEEGHEKYTNNETDENVYMFNFHFNGKQYYIDANNKHCKCHPKKLIKGRLINHSKRNPNVKPVVQEHPNGTPVILFIATKAINEYDEILFDYGSKGDRQSKQLDWMSQ